MSNYDNYTYATERMDEIHAAMNFHRAQIAKLEEDYLTYEADATEAYNAMKKEGDLWQPFYEKTGIE